jgi:CubicO group peptidase (beta-lactamase class C family)
MNPRTFGVRRLAVLLALLATACGEGPTGPIDVSIDLSQPWDTGTPKEVGGDQSRIGRAVEQARTNPRLLSLLVVRNGRLVVEKYFRGNRADSLNDVRSVTKSVVSALTGAAIERGAISGLDASIADYLDPDVVVLDPPLHAITIRHLLTMTSGFDWDESDGVQSYDDWILAADHIGYLLQRPVIDQPGTVFRYNSAAVHLLGVVLEAATGKHLPDLADEYLFSAIGIEGAQWEALDDGYYNGGSGIDLRPRDLAKFGQLYLQRGRSGNTQVLPESWVALSTQPKFSWRTTAGPVQGVTYGFLWWVVTGELEPAFFAWGYGGQFVYVVPSLSLVVVATTEWRQVSLDGGPDVYVQAALDVIAGGVVPAFRPH